MEKEVWELPCKRCGAYNRVERVFCLRCRRRLSELTPYDITEDDYAYPPDRDNLSVLQGTEPLPYLIERMITRGREKSLRSWLVKRGKRIEPLSDLDASVRKCGEILGLEIIPEIFIAPVGGVNAYTFGREGSPILVISSASLSVLDEEEMTGMIGHELAHIKSKHLMYHTLAESLAKGAGFLAQFYGMGLVAMPIQMLLLAWYKESEISADRAALLTVDDVKILESLMAKLARHNEGRGGDGAVGSLEQLFQTHPTYERRLRMIREFSSSLEFKRALEKIEKRERLSNVLVPVCRFCGAAKPVSKLFCEVCGKSQL